MFRPLFIPLVLVLFTSIVTVVPYCTPNISHIACTHNRAHCNNFQCNFTHHNQFLFDIHIMGCLLAKTPTKPLRIRLRHEIQLSDKQYGRGMYDFTITLCEIASVNMPWLNMFFTKDTINSVVGGCPHRQGSAVYAKNYAVNIRKVPSIGRKGGYRWSAAVISGKYTEIFAMLATGERCVPGLMDAT